MTARDTPPVPESPPSPTDTTSRWSVLRDRSFSGSLGSAAVSQFVLVVTGVLAARILGPADRGYFALLVVVTMVCVLAGGLGLPAALTYYAARNHAHARALVSALVRPVLLQLLATLALLIAVLVPLVWHKPPRVQAAAALALILVPGIYSVSYGVALLQGLHRFDAFNSLRVMPTVVYAAAISVVFLLGGGDLVSIMALWSVITLLGGLFIVAFALRGLPDADTDEPAPSVRAMVTFGLKSLLSSLSPVDALRLDQMIVGLLLSPVALGHYVVAQAFTGLPRLVATSIGAIAYPRVAADPDPASARRRAWKYFGIGTTACAILVGLLAIGAGTLVTFFFGNEFGDAAVIARILLIGVLFMTARRILTDVANGLGRPELGTVAEITSWIVLIPAVALFLPFGVEGVAIALAIAWAIALAVLLYLVLARSRPRADAPAMRSV